MILYISIAVAALIGAVIGVVIGRVMNAGVAGMVGFGLVMAVVAGGVGWFIAKTDLAPRQAFDQARVDIDTLPEVAILKARYPADYAQLQNTLEVAKNERIGAVGVRNTARQAANAVMLRQARLASDENLIRLMQVRRDKAEQLGKKSVAWCYDFTRGARLDFDPDSVVDPALVERERKVTADILEQTAVAPVKNAAGAQKDEYTDEFRLAEYYRIEVRDGVAAKARALFQPAEQKTIQMLTGRRVAVSDAARQGLLCRYSIAQWDETLKLSPDKAAMVYRFNLAKGL